MFIRAEQIIYFIIKIIVELWRGSLDTSHADTTSMDDIYFLRR